MKMRLAALALALIAVTPATARADATAFFGRNFAGDDRANTRGFAIGASMLVLGFEFEYANSSEDLTTSQPSLRTTAGNVSVQTYGLPFQLYATTGAGYYSERLGSDEETGLLLNSGGGVKIKLAGPLRVRIDYRIFTLKGSPRHTNVQRFYGGVNLAF